MIRQGRGRGEDTARRRKGNAMRRTNRRSRRV